MAMDPFVLKQMLAGLPPELTGMPPQMSELPPPEQMVSQLPPELQEPIALVQPPEVQPPKVQPPEAPAMPITEALKGEQQYMQAAEAQKQAEAQHAANLQQQQEAAAAEALAVEAAKTDEMKQQEGRMQVIYDNKMRRIDELEAERDAALRVEIDPRRAWSNKDTAGKVLTLISVALSSMSKTPGAMDQIVKRLKDEAEADVLLQTNQQKALLARLDKKGEANVDRGVIEDQLYTRQLQQGIINLDRIKAGALAEMSKLKGEDAVIGGQTLIAGIDKTTAAKKIELEQHVEAMEFRDAQAGDEKARGWAALNQRKAEFEYQKSQDATTVSTQARGPGYGHTVQWKDPATGKVIDQAELPGLHGDAAGLAEMRKIISATNEAGRAMTTILAWHDGRKLIPNLNKKVVQSEMARMQIAAMDAIHGVVSDKDAVKIDKSLGTKDPTQFLQWLNKEENRSLLQHALKAIETKAKTNVQDITGYEPVFSFKTIAPPVAEKLTPAPEQSKRLASLPMSGGEVQAGGAVTSPLIQEAQNALAETKPEWRARHARNLERKVVEAEREMSAIKTRKKGKTKYDVPDVLSPDETERYDQLSAHVVALKPIIEELKNGQAQNKQPVSYEKSAVAVPSSNPYAR